MKKISVDDIQRISGGASILDLEPTSGDPEIGAEPWRCIWPPQPTAEPSN